MQLKETNGAWEGEFVLPAWEGYQNRLGAYNSSDGEGTSTGLWRISVGGISRGKEPVITPAQKKALKFIADNDQVVHDLVLANLLPHYQTMRKEWGVGAEDDWMPEVNDIQTFKNMIGPSWLHLIDEEKDGMAYLGLELGCTWDGEHALGLMLHGNRILKIGGADISFDFWIARGDIKGES